MPARALSDTTGTAEIGDTWRSLLLVTGSTGRSAVPDDVTATVTVPAGTTAAGTVTRENTGLYRVDVDLAAAGHHQLVVEVTSATFGDDVLLYSVDVVDPAAPGTVPTLAQVTEYLGNTSATQAQIADALAAETAAQAAVCRTGPLYPDDLGQALKRRVARNLALRGLPLAVLQGDAESGPTVLPGRDVEVRRLEGPHRRTVVG
jgi:hypothetical protein